MERDKEIIEIINIAIKKLDEIDERINNQSSENQEIDYKISDILHYIENNELNDKECVKIVRLLKEFRLIRRSLRNEYEIEKTYKENSSKMMGNNTRGLLMAEINKKVKQLDNEYKYRVLSEEEIVKLIGEKSKRGRKKKDEEI